MAFEELDHYSEKILKLFLKFGSLKVDQLAVLLEKNPFDFSGYLALLLNGGYIQNDAIGKSKDCTVYLDGKYRPTMKGRIYFDLRFRSRLYAVSRSVLAPLAVSIIGSIVTTLITLFIKGL